MGATHLAFYDKFVAKAKSSFETDEFYQDFMMIIKSSQNKFSAYRRFVDKKIDYKWIEEIEKALPSLDKIVRNPTRFIKQEEELLPVELSRHITPDSIKHLSQHTNLINKIEDDGTVIPSHLLNIIKEESYETYENRFINTLLNRLYVFINKRYDKIFESLEEQSKASVSMDSDIYGFDGENIAYKMEISSTVNEDILSSGGGKQSVFLRLEKIRKIINEYATTSSFAKALKGTPFVRPPIMRTNAILKNPDMKICLDLWIFIESYEKIGYEVEISEGNEELNPVYIDELYSVVALNYALFRKFLFDKGEEENADKKSYKRKNIKPKFIKQVVEDIVENYDINEVEFKKVFQLELKNAMKKTTVGETKINEAIDRALKREKEFFLQEERLEKEKQKAKAERERLSLKKKREKEKLILKKQKEKERLRIKKEKQRALEKLKKEKLKSKVK